MTVVANGVPKEGSAYTDTLEKVVGDTHTVDIEATWFVDEDTGITNQAAKDTLTTRC